MKAELIKKVENTLKANLFNGLLAKPKPDLQADMQELQKLVSITNEYRYPIQFHFTENDDLCARSTKTFEDQKYRYDWTGQIDEKRRKADMKEENKLIAQVKKEIEKLNFNKTALANITEFINQFMLEDNREDFFIRLTTKIVTVGNRVT